MNNIIEEKMNTRRRKVLFEMIDKVDLKQQFWCKLVEEYIWIYRWS